jgi:hypothetical protein
MMVPRRVSFCFCDEKWRYAVLFFATANSV